MNKCKVVTHSTPCGQVSPRAAPLAVPPLLWWSLLHQLGPPARSQDLCLAPFGVTKFNK